MDLNNACVHPNVVRLPFAGQNGHYIDIKDRLNAGELEDLHATWQPLIKGGRGVEMQTRNVRFAKVQMYLLGWSLMDGGAPIKIDSPAALRGALDNLAPEVFTAIHQMIETHESARYAEMEEQTKKPEWRDRFERDIAICRAMNGWRLEWVRALMPEEYAALVTFLTRPAEPE